MGLFLLGLVIGVFIPFPAIRNWVAVSLSLVEPEEAAEDESAEGDTNIFDVTLAAQDTMGLRRGSPQRGDFTQRISLPAIVRERPAVSNLQAASKLAGIVRRIYVDVGQSVREGDRLVDLELADDALVEIQADLLDTTKQLEILQAEIARIEPIANVGGTARKNLLEKRYEEKRLRAMFDARRQELLVKGFSDEQLTSIMQDGRLVRLITVRVPEGIQPDSSLTIGLDGAGPSSVPPTNQLRTPAQTVSVISDDPFVYSIEELHLSPGAMALAGQPLCDLAYHETLLLEGQAYEKDLPVLNHLIQTGQGVTVQMGSDETPEILDNVPILYLDNHIDPSTQSVRFYLELDNSVISESKNRMGAIFRSWKYRPEQRGHVQLPARVWEDKLILPADAIAQDGLDHVVFRHLGEHRPASEPAHSEFQMVPVQVLYKDRLQAVVETGSYLKGTDEIALNNAYMLLLQMNKADGGGGHHHHDHD